MSNIYIQEPSTSGKVLLITTVGEIDIELWSKECPKACRNFIQLCLEGYYDGLIFHRVVKGFVVQGGCPNGDGTGGESIYGEPFKDEFHSRLRYVRRGMVGMANSDKNDNASQFFFTMAATPELQNKNTLFGKVTGNTVFNMLKLEECLVDHNERPLHPPKILKTEILSNPFDDIVIRSIKTNTEKEKSKNRVKKGKGVKNFGLLSFGSEAEYDEAQVEDFEKKKSSKSKSSHDALNDPKLSKESIKIDSSINAPNSIDENVKIDKLEKIREKLNAKIKNNSELKNVSESSDDEDQLKTIEQEKQHEMEEKKYVFV
ncbi:CWC27 family protein [Megaselia abdita]